MGGGLGANCKPMSWFWPQVFVLGYVGMFYFNALLMQRFNALWVCVVNTLGGPIAAGIFAMPSVVGEDNVVETHWPSVFISFTCILCGIVIKGMPQGSAGVHSASVERGLSLGEWDDVHLQV